MLIKDILSQDINRGINGVVKVGDTDRNTLEIELREYVVTQEIEKSMTTFFTAFEQNSRLESTNMGVWISGFFGSGKSHLLKMLAYLLENKVVSGKNARTYFAEKRVGKELQDAIDGCSNLEIETILFNIDSIAPMVKDSSAIIKSFSRVFYEHLGFFGKDLKIVALERYLSSVGRYEKFKSVIQEKYNTDWESFRKVLAIKENRFYDALGETLDISRTEAVDWLKNSEGELSISDFVEDVKRYVDSKPKKFRLVFLVDEIGQYLGNNPDLMLNLQTIVEELGSMCRSKVWVVVTSQESIDIITRGHINDFSKISARFSTRLPLSSTSVDEVIKKRILEKTDVAKADLKRLYDSKETVLRNLFTFDRSAIMSDVIAYRDSTEFVDSYPFAHYQFKLMQRAFLEIRKSGMSGQHMAGGERSMLSGFFEIASSIQNTETGVLVPFYKFYDTFDTFLTGDVRQVIYRAQAAARNSEGLESYDVEVLKLLFILRHVSDIRPTLENLIVLMVDNINADKVMISQNIQASLKRLIRENYVSKFGEDFLFLTDEEQTINKDIRDVMVDSARITDLINTRIFNEIYPLNKFKYGKYDFEVKKFIDNTIFGNSTAKLVLRILTSASEMLDYGDERLRMMSNSATDKEAIIVLSDQYAYYAELESAEKIRSYVRTRNMTQLPEPIQVVLRAKQQQASNHDNKAKELLQRALADAAVYIAGDKLPMQSLSVKEKIDRCLKMLVEDVYGKLNYIDENYENDSQLFALLNMSQDQLEGLEKNKDAIDDVKKFLENRRSMHQPVSIGDIQRRYQEAPYGFREIDIAAVVAKLLTTHKIVVQFQGVSISRTDRRLPDLLRKKTNIDYVKITIKDEIPPILLSRVIGFMKEFYNSMPVAEKVDKIIDFLMADFATKLEDVKTIEKHYNVADYPGRNVINTGKSLLSDVMSFSSDSLAFLSQIDSLSTSLLDWRDDFEEVQSFFQNQVSIFKNALIAKTDLKKELGFFDDNPEYRRILESIESILTLVKPYSKINELQTKLDDIHFIYNTSLQNKISQMIDDIRKIHQDVQNYSMSIPNSSTVIQSFDAYISSQINLTSQSKSISNVIGILSQVQLRQKQVIGDLNTLQSSVAGEEPIKSVTISKEKLLPLAILKSEKDIDDLVERIRKELKDKLKDFDSVTIS